MVSTIPVSLEHWEHGLKYIPRTGEGWGASDCLGPLEGGGQPGVLLMTSSKNLWPTHNIWDAYFIECPAFVTTNCIISSGGVYGGQADYNIKWIFAFSVGWQFSTWSAALKIMLLGMVVFIAWCWNDNALKIRSDVMSEWNAYLQSPSAY